MRNLQSLLGLGLAATLAAQTPSLLLEKSDGGTGSLFGMATCFVGDINDDGRSEIAFTSPYSNANGTGAGAVHVYRSDGTKLYTILGTAYQVLGTAIAAVGDVNDDGRPDFVVGGRGTVSDHGLMNLYSGADGSLLRSSSGSIGERFGFQVAGVGDIDADGIPDYACTVSHLGGLVLLWSGQDGQLLRTISLGALGADTSLTIANVGDIDGDGVLDLGVGISLWSSSISGCGTARVYSGKTGALLVERLGTTVNGALGTALAPLGGDWDGDGRVDFIVGAPGQDDGAGPDAGVVLVLSVHGTVLARYQGLPGDRLGSSVAGGGDVDGDRIADLVVGATGKYVRIYSGAVGHPPLHTLNALATNEGFARSLDLRGDLDGNGFSDLAVGAHNADPGRSGKGYVYSLGHSWLPKLVLDKVGVTPTGTGVRVCFVGDLDGDGRSELATLSSDWSMVAVFRADGTHLFDIQRDYHFETPTSLAAVGDVNGDGVADIALGSSFKDTTHFLNGCVTVHSGAGGALLYWIQGQNHNEAPAWIAAGVGDLNGDGYADFAAGSLTANAVRIWSGKDGALLTTIPGDANGELFGYAVAGVGDIDGDGVPDIGIGAPAATRRAPQGGLVRVYSGRTFAAIAEKTGNTTNEGLGSSIGFLGGDWDGDGLDDYVAGSPRNDDGAGFESGSLFVFNIYGHVLHRFDGAPGDRFGAVVTGGGDVDGDGKPEVAGASIGRYLKVFSGAGDHPTLHKIPATGSSFATWIDLRDDFDGDGFADLAVGTPGENRTSVYDLDHQGTPPRAILRGRACSTSDGRLPHIEVRGRSAIGTALGFKLRGAKSSAPVVMLLGLSMDLKLGPYGAPGCTAYVNPLVTVPGTANAAGYATLPSLQIPLNAALVGLRLDAQCGMPDAAANLLGVVLSTYATFWVGF